MKLVPKFTPRTRYYTITFYDHAGMNPKTVDYTFNQTMSDNAGTPTYQSRPDDGLQEHERYTFIGWINKKDFINGTANPTILDLTTIKVNQGTVTEFYPYYETEDATKVATNIDYFTFREETFDVPFMRYLNPSDSAMDTTYVTLTEYVIDLKPEYVSFLSGKVTLPSADKNGRPVTALGSVRAANITHIYFLPNAQYKILGELDNARTGFSGMNSLKYVYFPENMNTLKYIGKNCCNNISSLETIVNLPNSIEYIGPAAFKWCRGLKLSKLPTNLTYMGEQAFMGCANLTVTTLPHGYTQIQEETFIQCERLNITHIGNSTGGAKTAIDNNVTHVGPEAFSQTGNTNVEEIYLHNSVTYIAPSAFRNYGLMTGFTIYDGTGKIDGTNYDTYFGSRNTPNILDTDSH
jgi:hypothetical protein